MADYKEMYLTLMREVEKAIGILIDTQRRCEELYINTADEAQAVLVPAFPCGDKSAADRGQIKPAPTRHVKKSPQKSSDNL